MLSQTAEHQRDGDHQPKTIYSFGAGPDTDFRLVVPGFPFADQLHKVETPLIDSVQIYAWHSAVVQMPGLLHRHSD